MSRTVKEKSPLYMTIVLKDENGDPLTPSTVEWRLDNQVTGVEIVAWTNVPGPTSTLSIVIPGSNNLIDDETSVREARLFGVRVNSTLTSEAHDQFKYHVLNVMGASGV